MLGLVFGPIVGPFSGTILGPLLLALLLAPFIRCGPGPAWPSLARPWPGPGLAWPGPWPEILKIVGFFSKNDPNLALDMSFFPGANLLERLP